MKFQQTHIACYSIDGVSTDISRWMGMQKGTKKFGKDIYHFRVRLVNSIEKEYYQHFYERGIARSLLTGSSKEGTAKYLDSLNEHAKKRTNKIIEQKSLGIGLYLKIEVSRTIDLPVETTQFVGDWQDFFVGIGAFAEERETFKTAIDGLVGYFVCLAFAVLYSTYEGITFSRCLEYAYYHGGTGKNLYDYFLEVKGHGVVTKKESTKKMRTLAMRLRKAKVIYDEKTIKLYRKMIDEQDPLKKFLFGYFSLEIASNRAFKNHKEKYNLEPQLRDKRDLREPYAEMQNEYAKNATNSRDIFLLNAFFHWKGISKSDYVQFKTAKKTRDELSHGDIPEDSSIPLRELNHILAKVMLNELR